MALFTDTLDAAAQGKTRFLSWRSLITGAPAKPEEIRRFIEVKPRLGFQRPGARAEASNAIRAAARSLNLTPEHGVQVRLTGPVPLVDEEFATLTDRVYLMTSRDDGRRLAHFVAGARSFKIIFSILTTLFVGLAITMGVGLWFVGVFNIISIAFIALFVGLGVDFGIQFAVRYRHERHLEGDLALALPRAGRGVGIPLALAAAATAAGFFSFLPTTYNGVAELGKVAGIGMIVAFLLSITMLPALMLLLNPPGENEDVGFASLGRRRRFHDQAPQARHPDRGARRRDLAGPDGLRAVRFNPLNLRSPKVESVSTLLDLMKNPQTSPNTIDVPAFSLLAANELRDRIAQGSLVAQAITLSSFVPDQQTEKVALIADASSLLDATINPFEVAPAPSDAEVVASFRDTAQSCAPPPAMRRTRRRKPPARLAGALDAVVKAGPTARAAPRKRWFRASRPCWARFRISLKAAPFTVETIPADIRSDWVRQGRHRARPGLAQGHQQRSGGAVGLLGPGVADRAAGHQARPSPSASPARPSCRRLHRSGHPVLHRHHHPAGGGAAQPALTC